MRTSRRRQRLTKPSETVYLTASNGYAHRTLKDVEKYAFGDANTVKVFEYKLVQIRTLTITKTWKEPKQ